jgi:hypothetical protein
MAISGLSLFYLLSTTFLSTSIQRDSYIIPIYLVDISLLLLQYLISFLFPLAPFSLPNFAVYFSPIFIYTASFLLFFN